MLRATGGGRAAGGSSSWNNNSWSDTTSQSSAWPVNSSSSVEASDNPLHTRYRALYEFVGRNADEVSFQPGDIILVSVAHNISYMTH